MADLARITRRVFLRNTAAIGMAGGVVAAPAAEAAPRRVREVMEELERLIAEEAGGRWSIMLAADERMEIGGETALPLICFRRDRNGVVHWEDEWSVLVARDSDGGERHG
jgi:hypothetical protein